MDKQASWTRYLAIFLAVVLILSLAVVQGDWSNRWGDTTRQAELLVERLAGVPNELGDWVGEELQQNERALEVSGAVGHISRSYRNASTGERVSLFLVTGHARIVSLHTPDRCYPASGFSQVGDQIRYTVEAEGTRSDFYTTIFRKSTPEGLQNVRVFWTWGHDSKWQAPDRPHRAFAGVGALYKLYMVSAITEGKTKAEESPCAAFGELFLPVIDQALFSEPSKEPPTAAASL